MLKDFRAYGGAIGVKFLLHIDLDMWWGGWGGVGHPLPLRTLVPAYTLTAS